MKSDCVLNDHELEEKRKVIIRNRIKRTTRNGIMSHDMSHIICVIYIPI